AARPAYSRSAAAPRSGTDRSCPIRRRPYRILRRRKKSLRSIHVPCRASSSPAPPARVPRPARESDRCFRPSAGAKRPAPPRRLRVRRYWDRRQPAARRTRRSGRKSLKLQICEASWTPCLSRALWQKKTRASGKSDHDLGRPLLVLGGLEGGGELLEPVTVADQ